MLAADSGRLDALQETALEQSSLIVAAAAAEFLLLGFTGSPLAVQSSLSTHGSSYHPPTRMRRVRERGVAGSRDMGGTGVSAPRCRPINDESFWCDTGGRRGRVPTRGGRAGRHRVKPC